MVEEINKSEVNHSKLVDQLSEREKRALAAEKRMTLQLSQSDIAKYNNLFI